MRVIINTQGMIPFVLPYLLPEGLVAASPEPTVAPPVLLDLCTVAITHRFSSLSWWKHCKALAAHVCAKSDISDDSVFDKVIRLETGRAIAPATPSSFNLDGDICVSTLDGESHRMGEFQSWLYDTCSIISSIPLTGSRASRARNATRKSHKSLSSLLQPLQGSEPDKHSKGPQDPLRRLLYLTRLPTWFRTFLLMGDLVKVKKLSSEFELLGERSGNIHHSSKHDEAPLFTRDAYMLVAKEGVPMQYGVLGETLEICPDTSIQHRDADRRLYLNTNTPFSIVVCGVQGSGKSHTVACILECMFIPKYSPIGSLEKPLCGLVLHLGEGGPNSRPSEAAWLAASIYEGFQPPAIKVYVSPSSLRTMRGVYAALDGNITVEPLLLDEEELDAHAFLGMMAVSDSVVPPLYVQTMLSILRDLGEDYTYAKFKKVLDLKKKTWNPAQLSGLEQRLALLESFVSKKELRTQAAASPRFAAGQITIVDLSDPFIDTGSACGLFEVITRLFVRADVSTGRILVVDEAHKYLANNDSASGLTSTLLELTREQRHLGIRVIISTQEPTVIPPTLLDLCTVAIMHRFSSPAWWKALSVHVSADITSDKAFDKIVALQPGEALVFAPSGLATFEAPGLRLTGTARAAKCGDRVRQAVGALVRIGVDVALAVQPRRRAARARGDAGPARAVRRVAPPHPPAERLLPARRRRARAHAQRKQRLVLLPAHARRPVLVVPPRRQEVAPARATPQQRQRLQAAAVPPRRHVEPLLKSMSRKVALELPAFAWKVLLVYQPNLVAYSDELRKYMAGLAKPVSGLAGCGAKRRPAE
ncbi:hypothetical protein FIBSPDRAFT_929771 [Athelia psychrophila]|uniref:Zona occludens toxin N-terminal domain-containing protein n=1 Tax=Athelia psychrophila TaxID=1759441 RepID=A0A166N1Y8_9AGAM|nr:hypothetical protein FIBSPDRAFT_929771 [Fibularhizoctonia sp. CBS 109695]